MLNTFHEPAFSERMYVANIYSLSPLQVLSRDLLRMFTSFFPFKEATLIQDTQNR
jgi:hypothetical protein